MAQNVIENRVSNFGAVQFGLEHDGVHEGFPRSESNGGQCARRLGGRQYGLRVALKPMWERACSRKRGISQLLC
jgi:hypothetical protein